MKIVVPPQLKKYLVKIKKLSRFEGFILLIVFLLVYILMIFQVQQFLQKSPSDDDVAQKLQRITLPHIDQAAVDKMNNLRDQNVQTRAIFNRARHNPFSEK